MPIKVSVVIPVRDEEASIGLVLDDLHKVTTALTDYDFEVIVVDDGSRDGSAEIARKCGAVVVENGSPHGKGAALRRGFHRSTGEVIVMMDGDHSHRPEDLGAMLSALKPEVSLVVGSRIFGGSDEYTRIRAFGNILLTYAFGFFHGRYLSDALNGYKALRRDLISGYCYSSNGFEIEIELLANALRTGGRIVEVPSHERVRVGGRSKSRVIRHGTRFLGRTIYEWARTSTSTRVQTSASRQATPPAAAAAAIERKS